MNVLDSLKDFFMPADDNEPEAPNMTAPEEEPAAASTATAMPDIPELLPTMTARTTKDMPRSRQLHSSRSFW